MPAEILKVSPLFYAITKNWHKPFFIYNINADLFGTSLLCKVEFTLLQSIFSRQIFLLYFGKGKFGGKKFTLQKSEFYFAKEFFPLVYCRFQKLWQSHLSSNCDAHGGVILLKFLPDNLASIWIHFCNLENYSDHRWFFWSDKK